jgi:ribosome-associated protein
VLDDREIEEVFGAGRRPRRAEPQQTRDRGPARFDAAHSPSPDEATRARLRLIARRRMTADGELVIMARRFRTQERNREDAYQRLADLIRRAAAPGKQAFRHARRRPPVNAVEKKSLPAAASNICTRLLSGSKGAKFISKVREAIFAVDQTEFVPVRHT